MITESLMGSLQVMDKKTIAPVSRSLILRDAAICVSLANLCFLKIWSSYLGNYGEYRVLMRRLPSPFQYLSTAMDIFLLAAIVFACISWSRRRNSVALDRILLIASAPLLLTVINGLRVSLEVSNIELRNRTWALVMAGAALAYVVAGWIWPRITFRLIRIGLVCLVPFAVVTLGQSFWKVATYDSQALKDSPPAPILANTRTSPRVVWITFDAWDYRITFEARPQNLQLPAIDRFRSESLFATDAHSPGPDTVFSMPDLMTGRVMLNPNRPKESIEQHARYLAGIPLRTVPSIFDAMHQRGYNISVTGWHIPYGRWFPGLFADCIWWAVPTELTSTGKTFVESAWRKPLTLMETGNYSPFGQSQTAHRKAQIYLELMAHIHQALDNRALGFFFLHIPFPHPLHPYNRFTGRLDAQGPPREGYINSLALTDKIFADIRGDMERRGIWDESIVVVSSDHSSPQSVDVDGKSDPRVPYMLKLPGKNTPMVFTDPMHTIVTPKLLVDLVDGKLSTMEQVYSWLKTHAGDRQEPLQP